MDPNYIRNRYFTKASSRVKKGKGRRLDVCRPFPKIEGITEYCNFVNTIRVSSVNPSESSTTTQEQRFNTIDQIQFQGESGKTLIFNTRQAVIVGVKKTEDVMVLIQRLTAYLSFLNNNQLVTVHDCLNRNIVSKGNLNRPMDLQSFANANAERVTYDPENFSGARCQVKLDDDVTCAINVFASGRFIIPGMVEQKYIQLALVKLREMVARMDVANTTSP